MRHSTPSKILLSEYILLSYVVMLLAPISSFAADETEVINNTGSTIESAIIDANITNTGDTTLIENTGSNLIETTDSGATVSTGSIDIGTGELAPTIESNGTGETHDITPESPITQPQSETAVIEHVPVVESESEALPRSESDPENEILVQFKGDIINTLGEYQIDQVETLHELKTTEVITENNIAVMTPTAENIESIPNNDIQSYIKSENNERIDTLINELKKDPRVAHVQRNFVYTTQSVVNDPEYPKLWALNNNGQQVEGISGTPDADIDYPEAIAYASGKLNIKVIVAVLDTGIAYNHPDLKDHMWNGANCLSDTGAALGGCIHGYDFGDDDRDPADDTSVSPGHGTHIAGILGATSNNGTGTVGIASNVEIMAVKVFGNTYQSTTSSIIRGINFAKYNGAKIINASFGSIQSINSLGDFDMMTHDAIRDFPGLFIAAAGNDGLNTDSGQKFFPAGFGSDTTVSGEISIPGLQNIIAVAATDSNDELASFSNYGTSSVDIAAPGKNVYTTHHIVSSELYEISKGNGWIVSGENTINKWNKDGGSIYPDIHSVSGEQYVSGEMSYFQKTIAKNQFSKGWLETIAVLCNTPGTIENPTDYLTIDYKTNGNYIQLYKLNEANISLYGEASEMGPGMFAWINTPIIPLDNSDLIFRFGWHTDGIDDIDPNTGKPYLGCILINGTTHLKYSDNGETGAYNYKEGTSIATAHVAGAAALAWSYKPDASIDDIRNAIIWGGDTIPALSGKTMDGKRLNLKGILSILNKPVITSHTLTLSGESGARFSVETTNMDIIPQVWVSNNSDLNFHNQNIVYAEELAKNAIISKQSTENGYRLGDMVTRGELALIVSKIGGFTLTTCTGNVFTDVKSTLGDVCAAIEALADGGIISTSNTQFRPTANITRAEAIKLFLQAMGEEGSSTDAGYTDIANIGDLALYINRANELGCIESETYFHPNMSINRGDGYKIASCMMGLLVLTNTSSGLLLNEGFNLTADSHSDTKFEYSINQLKPDTVYYYIIQACTAIVYCNDDNGYVHSFRTPKVITTNISTPINIVSGEIYFSGSTGSGVSLSGSTGSGRIYLSNNSNSIKADIPTQGLRIISSGSWDGIMHSPKQYLSGNIITTVEGKQVQPETVFSIGSDTSSLIFSGQVVQISVTVNGGNGSTREIYRSPNILTPYSKIGTCTIQNNTCAFSTDHFSLFALSNPTTNTITTNTTGPGGGGGSSLTNTINTLTNTLIPSTAVSIDKQKGKISTSNTLRTLKGDIRTLQKKLSTLTNSNPEKRKLILKIQNLYKEQLSELRKSSQK